MSAVEAGQWLAGLTILALVFVTGWLIGREQIMRDYGQRIADLRRLLALNHDGWQRDAKHLRDLQALARTKTRQLDEVSTEYGQAITRLAAHFGYPESELWLWISEDACAATVAR